MNHLQIDGRSVNTLWAGVLVEVLWRCGVRQAVVSPGSRSTPLTLALARQDGIEAIPVLDERSAAFFALGLARRSFCPVALVCTSGTAGANYFPAVIEAQESGVPLIVLTADRPPELRACASGQTIDQQKLFGVHVNFYHELAVPEASLAMLAYLRQTVAHACQGARQPQFGPVHLNVPFRDPLVPVVDEFVAPVAAAIGGKFFAHLVPNAPLALAPTKIWPRGAFPRGVIVAGPANPEHVTYYVTKVLALARALGWPVLADGISPLRHGAAKGVTMVTAYDAILRNPAVADELRPQQVLCLGDWPTSKVLRAWLASSGAEIVQVSQRSDNRDALHGRMRHLCASVEALVAPKRKARATSYAAIWRKAERAARVVLASAPRARGGIFEGDVVLALAEALPKGTPVFVASSMPVRDVEYFWPATNKGYRFYFNRGANGIDGTLSTALGVAHGGAPSVLLTGDLAFLHDSNGLLLSAKLRGALTVVLINNRGGGIFEHLPVAGIGSVFEEFFATPQQVDFGRLCAAHGVDYRLICSLAELKRVVSARPRQGVRVLEVRTDRKRDAATRKELFATTAASLG